MPRVNSGSATAHNSSRALIVSTLAQLLRWLAYRAAATGSASTTQRPEMPIAPAAQIGTLQQIAHSASMGLVVLIV